MFADIAVAAKHLDAQVGRFQAHLGQKALQDGGVEAQFVVVLLVLGLVAFRHGIEHLVGNLGRTVDHRPAAFGNRLLCQAQIGVPDQRIRHLLGLLLARQRTHGAAFLRIGQSTLERQLGMGHALDGGADAGRVHEGEHSFQALVGCANQGTDGAVKVQHGRRIGGDAHLVF